MSCREPTLTHPREADLPEVGAGETEVVAEVGAGVTGDQMATQNVGPART